MSKLPTIPDFVNDPASMSVALRAVKEAVEILGGQRQGQSVGAPQMFVQESEPQRGVAATYKLGDMWINPVAKKLYFWTGTVWVALI